MASLSKLSIGRLPTSEAELLTLMNLYALIGEISDLRPCVCRRGRDWKWIKKVGKW